METRLEPEVQFYYPCIIIAYMESLKYDRKHTAFSIYSRFIMK